MKSRGHQVITYELFVVPITLLNCLGCCIDCCCLLTTDDVEVDLRQSTELGLELLVEAWLLKAKKNKWHNLLIYENTLLYLYLKTWKLNYQYLF